MNQTASPDQNNVPYVYINKATSKQYSNVEPLILVNGIYFSEMIGFAFYKNITYNLPDQCAGCQYIYVVSLSILSTALG